MTSRTRWAALGLGWTLATLGLPAPACAQDGATPTPPADTRPPASPSSTPPLDPSSDAELTDESIVEVRESMRPRGESQILYPAPSITSSPALPQGTIGALEGAGLPSLAPSGSQPSLLPEGVFIARRRGLLLATDWGASIFYFAPDAEGKRERPVVVLPCEELRRMESAASATDDRKGRSAERVRVVGSFVVSGQVFTYRGRNTLLPTAFALTDDAATESPTPTRPDRAKPDADASPRTRKTPPSPVDDPAIDDLISDLEALRSAPREATPVREAPAERAAEAGTLLAEGTVITRRRARLTRSARGEVAVVFDTDADQRGDAPMLLLPCAATEGLETASTRFGEATTFELSGRVFSYRDRNYFLPLMYMAETSAGIKPLQ